MKEKLNCVKTKSSLFIHHSSFCESLGFTPRKVSFDRAKGHVSSHQTWSFTRRKVSFRAPKPYLSQIQILQTARLQLKIRVTVCLSTLYVKPQKMPFFRPKDPFIVSTPHFLGSKFEYYFTIQEPTLSASRNFRHWLLADFKNWITSS